MIAFLLSFVGGMLLDSSLQGPLPQIGPALQTAQTQCAIDSDIRQKRNKRNVHNKNKIKVTVVVILACGKDGPIDRSLRKIAREIQRFDKKLTCFRLKSMKCKSLTVGEAVTFPLIEKQTAIVIVKKTADEKNRVVVAVKPPKQNQFQYRTVCGKFLPIITRYRTKAGQRLILAIRVQPCRDD